MPWDLRISQLGDLMFGPFRDWRTVSGPELLKQRMIVRLKIHRGSWLFDDTGELGSNMNLALRMNQPRALEEIPGLIEEALEPMSDEISIQDIQVILGEDEKEVVVLISFTEVLAPGQGSLPLLEAQSLRLVVLP